MKEAFAARMGVTPDRSFRDASLLRSPFAVHPDGALVAHHEGEVAGSALAMRWGDVGVFGPLTCAPIFRVASTVLPWGRYATPKQDGFGRASLGCP